jgi:diguanylate cyclase (GGDEF)-like protein/PAS domain S-box-containing protein
MTNFKFTDEALLSILDTLPIGVVLTNSDGVIVFSNFKVQDLLGFSEDELYGISVNDLVPASQRASHKKVLKNYNAAPSTRAMSSGGMLQAVSKSGEEIQIQIGLAPLEIDGSNFTLASIIEPKNQVLRVASYSDSLTGLANRLLFNEVSEHLRNLAIRNKESLALMFIDLDNFKPINDNFGHDIGDLVLCEVADVLTAHIRKNDIVGRIGGDEFVVCLYGAGSKVKLEDMANKLIKEISSIKNIKGNVIELSASIGAVFTAKPRSFTLAEMSKMADRLMYTAKRAGKGNVIAQSMAEDVKGHLINMAKKES